MKDLIKALKKVSGTRVKAAKTSEASKKTRRRAKITPEIKAQVKTAVAAGKTGAQIAKELGISVPSVGNIKKELGLVKKRK